MEEVINETKEQEVFEFKVNMEMVNRLIEVIGDEFPEEQPLTAAITTRALSDAISRDLGIDLSDGEWSQADGEGVDEKPDVES